MGWTLEQQNRLQLERNLLQKYFPNFLWYNPAVPGSAFIEGTMITNSKQNYKLRLIIPIDIPSSVPSLLIISPKPLYDRNYKSIADLGYSATMHVLSPINEYVKICHYKASHWSPNITFYKVLMKGRLWLEAYEAHRRTGLNLDYYLKHQT